MSRPSTLVSDNPANMRRWPNAGLLLDQRGRRANSKPTVGQRLVLTENPGYIQLLTSEKFLINIIWMRPLISIILILI